MPVGVSCTGKGNGKIITKKSQIETSEWFYAKNDVVDIILVLM